MDSSQIDDATNTKSASVEDKPLSTQVAQLQVSSSESSPQQEQDQEASSRSPEPTHPHDIADDISTGSDSSEDETHKDASTPRQELGLVISALQNTVQKSTPEVPPQQHDHEQQQQEQPSDTREEEEDHAKMNGNHAEELHSGDDDGHTTLSEQSEYDESSSRDGSMGEIVPPTPGTPPPIFEPRTSDDLPDVEAYSSANLIALHDINLKDIKANNLSPREQEKTGKGEWRIFHGVQCLTQCDHR